MGPDVAVLGGGFAGLATALILARDGHRVVLVERDPLVAGAARDAFGWPRAGIPHFLQPHAFLPRGRRELIDHFPDVRASLMGAGAHDVDLRRKLPGPLIEADDDLQYVGVRRPVIEWALRKAVLEQSGITLRAPATVRGIHVADGAVRGVELEGETLEVESVVDAMGRRSPMRAWLAERGHPQPTLETRDCGVIYYSRYYRLRPGRELPEGPWLLGPRGELGYATFSVFPGDDGTFAALFAVPTGVPELKALRHEAVFDAAVARVPSLRTWVDPDLVTPITSVLPMGGLQNTLAIPRDHLPAGLFVVGDALCHTDPVLSLGLSLSLIQAVELGRALRSHPSPDDAHAAYMAAVGPMLVERYRFCSLLDEQRLRMWRGEPVDFTRRDGEYALFSMMAAGACAMHDADIFRAFVRRNGLLDGLGVLDADARLLERIETTFRDLRARPRPALGPTREEMLAIAAMAPA
jgi:2-polyprenyl-6-methoxyphenol hydroxylase-like FAD-dependent oxidoreductase